MCMYVSGASHQLSLIALKAIIITAFNNVIFYYIILYILHFTIKGKIPKEVRINSKNSF